MSNSSQASGVNSYQQLLEYFSARPQQVPEPIEHPDASINRITRSQLESFRKASVLIPITRNNIETGSNVVLTVRSANLKSHAGQISLPGGTHEQQDKDEFATALRESEEEIGLAPDRVQVIGRLGEMALPSGFRVTPIVGLIDPDQKLLPCPIEVADIFQAPLELVLDPSAYRSSEMLFNDKPRRILELIYEDYRIWGATAAILFHLANEVQKSGKK